MSSSRYSEIARIFREAVELQTSERLAFLDEACGDDPELRREVESLLGFDESPHGILEEGEAIAAAMGGERFDLHGSDRGALPSQIGRYRVIELLGEGGMGSVFLAEQDVPKRTVALKVIRAGLVVPSALRRFERETRALAKLQHPGIAQIYDAGTAKTDRGACPFIAMEVVRGKTLLAYAEGAKLDVRARVRLVVDVCLAVQHAHDQGIIHRDIKPSNVLVTAEGRVKLLDFGIARLDDEAERVTLETRPGQIIGTLPYMSPEQFAHPPVSDARSDIYALGVLLFETLTGTTPHDLGSRPIADAVREKVEREPRRLSSINRALRGDLDTIVGVCLSREPSRRYASALDLARDLERHLEDQPISARPASAWYQLAKYARRNRRVVALTSLVVLSLVVATVTSVIWSVQAEEARVAADAAEAESARQAAVAVRRAYVANIAAAGAALESGNVSAAMQRLSAIDPVMRDTWEYRHFSSRLNDAVATWQYGKAPVESMTPTGRGNELMVTTWDRRLEFLRGEDLTSAQEARTLGFRCTASQVDRRRGWVFLGGYDGTLRHFPLGDPKQLSGFNVTKQSTVFLRLNAEGTILAICDRSSAINVLKLNWPEPDPITGQGPPEFEGLNQFEGRAIALTSDGQRIAVAKGKRIEVRDVEDGALLATSGEQVGVTWMVDFSPDGKQVLSGAEDRCARVWELPDQLGPNAVMSLRWMQRYRSAVGRAAWSPDGQRFACFTWDGALHVHDMTTGGDLQLLGNFSNGDGLVWLPDGSAIATSGQDRTVRLWPWKRRPFNRSLPRQTESIYAAAIAPDGKRAYCATRDGSFRAFDVEEERELWVWKPDPAMGGAFVLARNRPIAYAGLAEGALGTLDLDARTVLATQRFDAKRVDSVALNADGTRVAAGLDDGRVEICDATTLARLGVPITGSAPVRAVTFAAKRGLVIAGDSEGRVNVASLDGSRSQVELHKFTGTVSGVAIAPDESLVYASSTDNTVRAWSLVDDETFGKEIFRAGTAAPILSLTISPDGTRIVGGVSGGGLALWDAHSGESLLLVNLNERSVESLGFDQSGLSLIHASNSGTISVLSQRAKPAAKPEGS